MSKVADIATQILDILDKVEFTIDKVKWVVDYLQKYGYLVSEETFTLEDFIKAVSEFQEFFSLTIDGDLGPKTLRAMTYKRCSMPDKIRDGRRRQAKWGIRDLTYRITGYVGDEFTQEEQDRLIQSAFDSWSKHTNITVETTNGSRPNMLIGVGRGQKDNFDGSSGTLAWAYLPDGRDNQINMKFDMDERWIKLDSRNRGIALLNVAAHEIGHLLGLEHSKVQGALMAPSYSPRVSVPQSNDDIPRIQALYGRATQPTPGPSEPKPDHPPRPDHPPKPDNPETNLIIKVYGNVEDIDIEGYRIDKIGSLSKIDQILAEYGR